MQHDLVIENNSGRNVRLDINDALGALVSNSSGSTAPVTTYAFQFWVDTSGGSPFLKMRNAANNGWIDIGDVGITGYGALLKAGGTMTGALLAATGTIGAGPGFVVTPGIAFAGDADTGFYRASANRLAFVVGGAVQFYLDAALYPEFASTACVLLPRGTTAERPATGVAGMLRYNSSLNQYEGYRLGNWGALGGGGGGGAGFQWREIPSISPAPVAAEEFGELAYNYAPGGGQDLYASLKVGSGYTPGSQLSVLVTAYSPSAAGTMLLSAQSTLIRKNTDAVDSITNQRTTTNTALTNTVAKQHREITLDVTDSSGLINGVAVSAGDTIKMRLYRGTDTDTADIRLIPNSTDLKLS